MLSFLLMVIRRHVLVGAEVTDEVLMERYRDGDVDAFEVLLNRHERKLFNFIYRLVGHREKANDLLQETFRQRSYPGVFKHRDVRLHDPFQRVQGVHGAGLKGGGDFGEEWGQRGGRRARRRCADGGRPSGDPGSVGHRGGIATCSEDRCRCDFVVHAHAQTLAASGCLHPEAFE